MFVKSTSEMEKIATSQIGKSACGPTAILNILAGLGVSPLPTPSEILTLVPARLRDYETPSLAKYLLSRVRAGTIHEEILKGVEVVTGGSVVGKFFTVRAYEDPAKFEEWAKKAFEKNIVLFFTENLFLSGGDAWHHQMAYGVENHKIFLTNPLEAVDCKKVLNWITSGPWMIIPPEHVLARTIKEEDLKEFEKPRWEIHDILSQVKSILLSYGDEEYGSTRYNGLTIPWGGLGGVTMFCRRDNKEGMDWMNSYGPEQVYLPFYDKYTDVTRLTL